MLPIPPAPAKRSGSRYTLHIVSLQVAQHFNLRPQCTMRACLSANGNSMSKTENVHLGEGAIGYFPKFFLQVKLGQELIVCWCKFELSIQLLWCWNLFMDFSGALLFSPQQVLCCAQQTEAHCLGDKASPGQITLFRPNLSS